MTEEQKYIYNLVMDRVSGNLPLQLFVEAGVARPSPSRQSWLE